MLSIQLENKVVCFAYLVVRGSGFRKITIDATLNLKKIRRLLSLAVVSKRDPQLIQIPRLRNSDEQVAHDEEPPPERLGLIRLRTLFKTVGTNFDLYNKVH